MYRVFNDRNIKLPLKIKVVRRAILNEIVRPHFANLPQMKPTFFTQKKIGGSMYKLYLIGLYYTLRRAYQRGEINENLIKQILEEIRIILNTEEDYESAL